MIVNILGLGYIGLPTAIILASKGVEVIGTDINAEIVEALISGTFLFQEKGMEEIYEEALANNIQFSNKIVSAEFYIVAVPTPYEKKGKRLDAQFLISAVKEVADKCPKGAIVVIESTISPGTIDKYIKPIIEESGLVLGQDIHIAHAPERIIPGDMINELVHNPRVIGADCKDIAEKIKTLYSQFCDGEIVVTDIRTAEMSKVVENTYRDINIAFANELAKICRSDGMDVYEIIKTANMHPRVNILQPGPGVGGHCISVDPWFLVGDYPGLANIVLAARKINDSMPEFVLERISEIMQENGVKDISKVGLYGLTYKEDVDDIRESPTLQLLENMKKHLAAGIKVFDPMLKSIIVENQYLNFDQFINDIEIIVIMVGHRHIKKNLNMIKNKIVFDTRNVCNGFKAHKL